MKAPIVLGPGETTENLAPLSEEEGRTLTDALVKAGFSNPRVIYMRGRHQNGYWLAYPYEHFQGSKVCHRNLLDQFLGPDVDRALQTITNKTGFTVKPWHLMKYSF